MKALVLTHDRYRRVTEHMLKTYAVHWPKNNLTFRIPYQYDMQLKAYGQSVELVQTSKAIKETVSGLLKGLADDEWIYWCVDDKYVVAVDAAAASYFSESVCSSRRSRHKRALFLPRAAPTSAGFRKRYSHGPYDEGR